MHKGYILVYTTSSAFFCEDLLKNKKHIDIKLVPTPREFSSDCGISVYFECKDIEKLTKILNDENVEFELKLL
ncbi:MAG: DUF3343 domain-containing protein [Campylobacteraceae bacterium]